jgi:pimeloyl-ACP methyl ester carboxylesterase
LSITGGIYLIFTRDAFWRSFGLQAAAWGAVDALIAVWGGRGLSEKINQPVNLAQSALDARKLRRILWINAGLDLLYISAGLAAAYTLGQNSPAWRGTGWGIAVQGVFLLGFDLLHALFTPEEVILPDLNLFDAPEHQPFLLPGSNGWTAVLVHGFPGTPAEMRDLGCDLHENGWTVEGLQLPGFGRDYPRMFVQRAAGWIETIAGAVKRHQEAGQKVMLVGFSMGAGLSAPAAVLAPPERLVLLSPFWFDENLAARGLIWTARLLLPASIQPFGGPPIVVNMLQKGADKSAPEIDLSRADIRAGMRRLRLPLVFLEQFREIGFRILRAYPRRDSALLPTLVMRGQADPLVSRRRTQRLARLTGACFVELPGEHHIYIRSDPAYPQALKTILEFAQEA